MVSSGLQLEKPLEKPTYPGCSAMALSHFFFSVSQSSNGAQVVKHWTASLHGVVSHREKTWQKHNRPAACSIEHLSGLCKFLSEKASIKIIVSSLFVG